MATQKIYWECGFCKRLYDEQSQASVCEEHHRELSDIRVIDFIDTNAKSGFPEKILLRDPQQADLLAEYQLSKEGAINDFYQSDEYWYQTASIK